MRILYSHRVQSRDGQSVHIDELVAAFRAQGHQVRVVGPGGYAKAKFGGESTVTTNLRRFLPGALRELVEVLYNLSSYRRLRKAFADFAPDFVYERYSLYHLAGVMLKRFWHTPLYLEVNSPLADERARFGGLSLPVIARLLERLTWHAADRIFVVTGVLGQLVAASGVPADRITVIPNGINLSSFPLSPYQAKTEKHITLGFIGFVREWHGLDAVIAGLAAEQAPPIRVIIAGDGPARQALESQTEALGVRDLVDFLGVQQRSDVPDLIRQFDIALQPRAVAYASPLKLFEYMAAGRAIVAPDQPNIREILEDEKTALLFDPEKADALWQAIRRLAKDPALRQALGTAARQALEVRDYTWRGNAIRVTSAVAADAGQLAASEGVLKRGHRSGSFESR